MYSDVFLYSNRVRPEIEIDVVRAWRFFFLVLCLFSSWLSAICLNDTFFILCVSCFDFNLCSHCFYYWMWQMNACSLFFWLSSFHCFSVHPISKNISGFFFSRMFYKDFYFLLAVCFHQQALLSNRYAFFARSLLTYFNVIWTFLFDDNDKYQPNKTSFIFIVEITKEKKLVALIANDDVITLHTIASKPILHINWAE